MEKVTHVAYDAENRVHVALRLCPHSIAEVDLGRGTVANELFHYLQEVAPKLLNIRFVSELVDLSVARVSDSCCCLLRGRRISLQQKQHNHYDYIIETLVPRPVPLRQLQPHRTYHTGRGTIQNQAYLWWWLRVETDNRTTDHIGVGWRRMGAAPQGPTLRGG